MRRFIALLALPLLLVALPAAAQDDLDAKKLFKKGVQLAKEGSYEEAISYFEEARSRGAPDETLFNMGKCYEALGLYHVAVEYYQKYLDSPKPQKVKKIKNLMEELRLKPSTLTFNSIPEGAEVRHVVGDGTESKLGVTPFEYKAEAGEFTFSVVKEGYPTKKFSIETGYGKPFDLQISLGEGESSPGLEVMEKTKKVKKFEVDLGFPKIGLMVDLGGGVALYPYPGVDFRAGGDFTLGVSYRFAHGVDNGLGVGLRLDIRSLKLTTDTRDYSAIMAHILAVPAYQIRVHEILGLEFSLPVGVAILSVTEDVPTDERVDLLRGYLTSNGLAMFELGVAIGLRIRIVSALYAVIEPLRFHLLVPFAQWRPALVDMDILVRIGFEF